MTDPRVGQLRNRLRLLGDLKPQDGLAERGGDANFYDESLVPAVKWMQYRHGLAQDGAVGRRTLAALNVPIEQRIEQMILNLERRRWMVRSEEHTSELQSLMRISYAVFCLKKKNKRTEYEHNV